MARFTGGGLGATAAGLKTALLRAIAGATGLAALLALVTGVGAARWLTRPVVRLIAVTRRSPRRPRAPGQPGRRPRRAGRAGRRVRRDGRHAGPGRAAATQPGRRTSPMSCARRSPSCSPAMRRCSTGWPPTPPLGSLRDQVPGSTRMVARTCETLAGGRHSHASACCARPGRRSPPRQRHSGPVRPPDQRRASRLTGPSAGRTQAAPPGHHSLTPDAEVRRSRRPRSRQPGQRRRAAVSDAGRACSRKLPRIFRRFWRGQRAAGVSGSGVGLAVAAELARAHGGQLTARSSDGQGAEFTLTLPRA